MIRRRENDPPIYLKIKI